MTKSAMRPPARLSVWARTVCVLVRDHRGRWTTLVSTSPLERVVPFLAGGNGHRLSRSLRREVRPELKNLLRGASVRVWVVSIGLPVVLVSAWYLAVARAWSAVGGSSFLSLVLGPVICQVVGMVPGIRMLTFERRDYIARAFLNRGLCPTCAYALKAVTPESDQCRVCPECGAAWRLEELAPATSEGVAKDRS